jgi:HTH-type transcriptional regulator, competence development regulator
MKADLVALGALLRDARNALGLSLREVEAKAGVSNAYLSQLEGAKIKQPSPAILHKLCEVYGTSYSVALEFAGYPVPAQSQSSATQRFASRLGRTTPEEESALVEYLQFLRTRKR